MNAFRRDASRKRYNYRLSSQEVVFQKSIEFLQTINVYKYFQNNTAYLGDITVQFIGSNYM